MARERKGSMVKRDAKIYARVKFADENGKRRDLWRKTSSSTHARQLVRQLLNGIENTTAKQLDSSRMTFADASLKHKKSSPHSTELPFTF